GGNAKELKQLPPGTRLGHNQTAFRGGFRVWTVEGVQTLWGGEEHHIPPLRPLALRLVLARRAAGKSQPGVCQQWRWTGMAVTQGLVFVASLRLSGSSYAKHYCRSVGDDQQYPTVLLT